MKMVPVTSETVREVGYDPSARVLRVAFGSGGVFDYRSVDPHVYKALRLPHRWCRVGRVRAHAYRRVTTASAPTGPHRSRLAGLRDACPRTLTPTPSGLRREST